MHSSMPKGTPRYGQPSLMFCTLVSLNNFRFLKDCSNLMRWMNCMRRWRMHGDNIVGLLFMVLPTFILPRQHNSKIILRHLFWHKTHVHH